MQDFLEQFLARVIRIASGSTRCQTLEQHLRNVAETCERFAASFGSEPWGQLAGLWHDVGKYQDAFQKRLRGADLRVEHSAAGALLAYRLAGKPGLALAFAVAGHHGGLADATPSADCPGTSLRERLSANEKAITECLENMPDGLRDSALPELPFFCRTSDESDRSSVDRARYRLEMWTRFLFSCLVDADRLDAEAFSTPEKVDLRARPATLADLRNRCDSYIDGLVAELPKERAASPVNLARAGILVDCRQAANSPQGFFSLTVPTGGGKTLSGLSFALRHAEHHGLDRVFVVIPYTSIIEQNAAVYRKCLSDECVLEHHSNLDPEEVRERGEEAYARHSLAAENWDAQVVVTTTVQFFETLFAAGATKARKLHNLARSVIVLDEVQTVPPQFLLAILDGLTQLVEVYRCSVVLSTATPPALSQRERFPHGLHNVRPIIVSPERLSETLHRTRIEWPEPESPAMGPDELAATLAQHTRVLCIVHSRRDARETAEKLAAATGEDVFHLSALMCPAHRLQVIHNIKALGFGAPCRVVSTQLVEAGVDLDFPVVYRAMAGLDSIVQAAGRCNREGRLDSGRVIVFRAKSRPPAGVLRSAMDLTEGLLREQGERLDAHSTETSERFFRELYFNRELDERGIQPKRRDFRFASVARDFRLIEDGFTHDIIVPWGEGAERLDRLRAAVESGAPNRSLLRSLQPFVVRVYDRSFTVLERSGALEEVMPQMYALAAIHAHHYSERYGLSDGDEYLTPDPSALMVCDCRERGVRATQNPMASRKKPEA